MEFILKTWRFMWKYSLSYIVDLQVTIWESIVDQWDYIVGTLFAVIIPIAKVVYLFTAFNIDPSSFRSLYYLVLLDLCFLAVEMFIVFMVASDVMDDKLYYEVALAVWIILFSVELVVFPYYAYRHLKVLQSMLYLM